MKEENCAGGISKHLVAWQLSFFGSLINIARLSLSGSHEWRNGATVESQTPEELLSKGINCLLDIIQTLHQ